MAISLLVVISAPAIAGATTYLIKPDGSGDYPTIQLGIDAAADSDTVCLDNGVFTGPGNKNLDTKGKAIVIRSLEGPDSTIIDCESDGRGFFIHSGESPSTVICGVQIRFAAVAEGARGGGVLCLSSSPLFLENVFYRCSADTGGGACFFESSSTLIRNRFTRCGYYYGTWSDPVGGGVFSGSSSLNVFDNVFEQNGGGWKASSVYAVNSTITVTGNLFLDNGWIEYNDGAVYAEDCDINLLGNTFAKNHATHGAGITVVRCTGEIRGNKLIENWGYISGGGIRSIESDLDIAFNYFSRNNGGGIDLKGSADHVYRNIITRSGLADMFVGSGIQIQWSPAAVIENNTTYHNLCWTGIPGQEMYIWGEIPVIDRNLLVGGCPEPIVHCDNAPYPYASAVDTVRVAGNFVDGNWYNSLYCIPFGAADDPMFCDPDNENWFLRIGSPAYYDTLLDGTYYEGFFGALPIGCGLSDLLQTEMPPDARVTPGSGLTHVLSGFRITNISGAEASVNYELLVEGGILDDNGDPLSFVGVSPILAPGESFSPPEAAVVVPDPFEPGVARVRYLVSYAPALTLVDTFVTTITFDTAVPVAVEALEAESRGGRVELSWVTTDLVDVEGWKLYRNAGLLTPNALPADTRSFVDHGAELDDLVCYRLAAIVDGAELYVAETSVRTKSPQLTLLPNIPNPFNPITVIRFTVPENKRVVLGVYSVDGGRVASLVDAPLPPGPHEVEWDGRDEKGTRLASGVYFFRLRVGRKALTRKIVLIR